MIIQYGYLAMLIMFYFSYFVKMYALKKQGINGNILGKGNKPKKTMLIEIFLRAVTFFGAIIQLISVLFPNLIWSFLTNECLQIVGIILALIGNVFFIMAIITMKNNWRAGFNNNQNTKLVTSGIYKISRNPAFVGFDLIYIGCAISFPNILNILITIIAVVLFHIQIIGEESYLVSAFGKEYVNYKSKARRYI